MLKLSLAIISLIKLVASLFEQTLITHLPKDFLCAISKIFDDQCWRRRFLKVLKTETKKNLHFSIFKDLLKCL